MKQLLTSEDFTAAQRGGGLIGIFDKHTGDRLHLLPCSFVRQEYFYEKVVRRGGKNGRYVLYESIDEIPAEFRDDMEAYSIEVPAEMEGRAYEILAAHGFRACEACGAQVQPDDGACRSCGETVAV